MAWGATDDFGRRLDNAVVRRPSTTPSTAPSSSGEIGASFPIADNPTPEPAVMTPALYIRRCTQPTDRIFIPHYIPQVPALGERGFAVGQADLRLASSRVSRCSA